MVYCLIIRELIGFDFRHKLYNYNFYEDGINESLLILIIIFYMSESNNISYNDCLFCGEEQSTGLAVMMN